MSRTPRNAEPKPSCAGCFFGRNALCALELDAPCATFRPDSPEGLQPQRQLRFAFRVADAPHAPHGRPRPARRPVPQTRPEQPVLAPSFAG